MTKPVHKLASLLENIQHMKDARLRFSSNGVPHLVLGDYSVCYFGKHKSYRVFYPWPGFYKGQTKTDFKTETEVTDYFKDK